jgi:hypothetical protein
MSEGKVEAVTVVSPLVAWFKDGNYDPEDVRPCMRCGQEILSSTKTGDVRPGISSTIKETREIESEVPADAFYLCGWCAAAHAADNEQYEASFSIALETIMNVRMRKQGVTTDEWQ